MLWEPLESIGHFVVVEAVDPLSGALTIADPAGEGQRYSISVLEFIRHWTLSVVWSPDD